MSEYQYYEFRAVDRPLTQKQMAELRSCSSRASISPDSFVNEYDWGDLKGDPDRWMEKYFDAFLYLANWGTRRLMLRVPTSVVDPADVREYCSDDSLNCRINGDNLIISFRSDEEESEWVEGEGWLGSLMQLRSDLTHGDYRCLYLGWLLAAQTGEFDDDTLEPHLPAGLGTLHAPLGSLADFLRIDPDLIAAAAEKSGAESASRLRTEEISDWVARLPPKDKDAVLTRLLTGDDLHIAAELRHRALSEIRDQAKSRGELSTNDRRTVSELIERSEAIEEQRQKREAEQQERERVERERAEAEERKKRIEALIGKENSVWAQVDKLIATRQPGRYDEAVLLLEDLLGLAALQGTGSEFARRMRALCLEHAKKTTLLERFRKAKLSD